MINKCATCSAKEYSHGFPAFTFCYNRSPFLFQDVALFLGQFQYSKVCF